jgi:hypothetical protein
MISKQAPREKLSGGNNPEGETSFPYGARKCPAMGFLVY